MTEEPFLTGEPALAARSVWLRRVRAEQAERWRRGERVLVEAYLEREPALDADTEAVLDLVYSEALLREERGEHPTLEEYVRRFPQYEASLRRQFELHQALADSSLLGDAAGPETLPPRPAAGAEDAEISTSTPGRAAPAPVGPVAPPGYEILGELGRGGMGIVYRARQVRLNRLVAIKMILSGEHARPEDLTRFLAEAEAVAALQHPHIVQIFEVGQHAGLPFFVLEYLEGGSLSQKLRGTPLPATEAAQLVERLARAMHAAHERGIIHRDLKPANVLLDKEGRPKVTDFGLSKRVAGPGGNPGEPGLTQSGAIMGTPSYMAPEQAEGKGKGISPAADVYALGAILYELLTGRPPFKAATPLETVYQVLHDEPVSARRLQPKTPCDLETICLKCLGKDPTRRYPTALALADDLGRFLAGKPIRARPVGAGERTWRWCRRNPAVAGLSAALVLALVGGLIGVTLLWRQADTQRVAAETARGQAQQSAAEARQQQTIAEAQTRLARAEADKASREARKASETAQVLIGMFEATDPLGLNGIASLKVKGGEDLTALQMLERGARRVERDLGAEPETQAKLLDTIGGVYCTLGQTEKARPLLEKALALRQRVLPGDHPDLAATLHNLGWLYHQTGDYATAKQYYREALAIRQRYTDTDSLPLSLTMLTLGWLLADLEEFVPAEELIKGAIDLREHHLGPDHRDTAVARVVLAAVYLAEEKYAAALPLYQRAMVTLRQVEGGRGLAESIDLFQRGVMAREVPLLRPVLRVQGSQGVVDCFQRSLELAKKTLGDRHVYVALVLHELAYTLAGQHQDEAAERYFRDCLDIVRRSGLEHPKATYPLANFGALLVRRGKAAEAEQLLAEALEARRRRYPANHYLVAEVQILQAALLEDQSPSQRRQLLREALTSFAQSPAGPNRWVTVGVRRLAERLPPAELADVACELARAAAIRGEKGGERHGFQDLALGTLRRAREKGFRDVERLRHDKDLDHLRRRPEFQKLLMG